MAVQNDTPLPDRTGTGDNDQSGQTQQVPASGTLVKEQEPAALQKEETKILSEIIKSSEAADEQAEKAIQEAITEAKLAKPEPKLAPDVADSGVKSPQQEADEVIIRGSTISLPIEEEEYKKGLHQKVAGAVANKVVYGVSGLFALATWVGKVIKFAHKHAMKVVFRKGEGNAD